MRRRKATFFFLVLGICLIAIAVALNIGWILLNLREVVLLVFGIIFFAVIITGLILNTIFLVREIRRNEQHDAFLNAVTHELKTPIASIKLYLETLKTRDVAEEKRHEFYDIMIDDSNRLLDTVEQVLQASRTREKNRRLNTSEIDLGKLINECVKIIQTRYKLDDATVKFTEPAEPLVISGDASELQIAFTNLLDNAVKYSKDEPKITIKIRNSNETHIEIFFKDTGVGIAPNEIKRIFKRFYRVPGIPTIENKGSGLGLPIVKSIIKKHGGRIRAESKGEGKGSLFIVQLRKR
ncbi:MAG: sensor histidine kinase [Acidobacteria bacterium]|jgi:signal transduction histidine kinase|nr:sensor histidine kinase [Acidobacteriota bacterium]